MKKRGCWNPPWWSGGQNLVGPRSAQGNDGRDHNPFGFTMWMAGGGVKGGMTYGETDDQHKVGPQGGDARSPCHHDASMGLDHTKITFRYSGRDMRLTDVFGNVIKDILARARRPPLNPAPTSA
ncbi:MAG: DUF1501 domain-containing protein [Verrucomicrobiales bacterium]